MENLPFYIGATLVLSTAFTAFILFKATNYSKPLVVGTLLWLGAQSALALSGFYQVAGGIPPRFGLLLLPPVVFVSMLFIIRKKALTEYSNIKLLTLLHIVRIPVELTLYWLFEHKTVPGVMTFAGSNFDILSGLSAPFIYYFGYVKKSLSSSMLLLWNILCLLLLGNIVVTAVLSGPFAFQRFGFDQPNIALLYFPFIWLPCFIVPSVLFAHLAAIKSLLPKK